MQLFDNQLFAFLAQILAIPYQNQTFTVMKTSTLILSMGLLVLVSTTKAVSQATFYFNSYGDQLAWNVPQAVLYKLGRSYYGYDIVHVRQVPVRGFTNFEVIIESNGRFVMVNIDHYGGILNARQIVYNHFDHHICDLYCGFHANHYQRFYRPRPVVVVNKYHHHNHGHGYGYGNGHQHKDYSYNNGHHNNNHQNGHHDGKYNNNHSNGNKYRDSQNGKGYQNDGRRDNNQNNSRGSSNDKYRGQSGSSSRTAVAAKTESTGYRSATQGTRPGTTSTARQLATRGN